MGKYFTVEELCVSAVARSRGIDNTPPPQAVAALHDLIGHLLDPLREAWGGPVAVNSGYRSPALNAAVAGRPVPGICTARRRISPWGARPPMPRCSLCWRAAGSISTN